MLLTSRTDVSRSISGEVFVAAPDGSKLLRISNFVAEQCPPYTFRWVSQGVQSISPQLVDDLIVFYFRCGYSVLPISQEQDIRTLYTLYCSDAIPSPTIHAIIFAIAALSAKSRKCSYSGEWYGDVAEWCYGTARNALSGESNDAQFEYLFASTLLVSPLDLFFQL